MVHLSELRASLEGVRAVHWKDQEVRGLTQDSRQVASGWLFVACREANGDGHDYVPQAVANGACGIVVERAQAVSENVVQLVVSDSHEALSRLAVRFYGDPSAKLDLIGVTGTNGKTTTTKLVEGVYRAAGRGIGLIGTISCSVGTREVSSQMTTPMAHDVQRMLREMVDEQLSAAVMEVSSHSLMQHRVDGCRFDCGVFTNLSREHLDYHKTLQAYAEAKRRLFEGLDKGATAAMNADDPVWRDVLGNSRAKLVRYGIDSEAEVKGTIEELGQNGSRMRVKTPWGELRLRTPLLGRHNAYNCLSAAAACGALGIERGAIEEGIASVGGVAGRLERIEAGQPFAVLVDYAHTDDAMEKVLASVREVTRGRIVIVFGCGGNRDREKRPRMGRVAERLADEVVVTSDNPRGEEPATIIGEVLGGMENRETAKVEPDREKAIKLALESAGGDDVVLIAGKGHETRQLFRDRVIPFDDREVARRLLGEMGYHA